MRLGITSYTLRWAVGGDTRFGDNFKINEPLDAFNLVNHVSELGLKVLQIADNINFDLSDSEYKRLGKYAESKNVILQLGTGGIKFNLVKKLGRISDLIGANLLNMYPTECEPVNEVVNRIRGFLPLLRNHQLTLTLENEDSGIYTSRELAEILGKVDDPLVGACIDTMNSTVILENPLDTVRTLAPYATCFHLKDFTVKRASVNGFSISGVPVGTGMLDIKAIFRLVKEADREPDILLEQFMGMKETVEETLRQETEWLRKGITYIHSIT
jgi:sugar phosphate isomerase/epimerase